MKKPFERRSTRWWVLSILAHGVLIAVLAQIIFRYPIGQVSGIPKEQMRPERIQWVDVSPMTQSSGGSPTTSQGAAPAALQPPREVPKVVAPPPPPDSSRSQAAGGTGSGEGSSGDGGGFATGIAPRAPDSRIALNPSVIARVPRPTEEAVDSIVELAVGIVRDSLAILAAQRAPGDWTRKGKDGQVWGWDPQGNIRLGKFTIPGALLALLPLNSQSRIGPIEGRSLAYIRRDVLENAQRSINEDEFRAAVKRIRERKERERREGMIATTP